VRRESNETLKGQGPEFVPSPIFFMMEAVLPLLKDFVELFQSHEPLVHKLHDKMEELSRAFLACFVKSEKLEGVFGKKLKNFHINDGKLGYIIAYFNRKS
jgi:hypothetical protein